jgi:hypothetical protein
LGFVAFGPLTDPLHSFCTKLSLIFAKERAKGYVEAPHTEAQRIGAAKQAEAGRKVEDVGREVGMSKQEGEARRDGREPVKQLRDENMKLRKLVADLGFG